MIFNLEATFFSVLKLMVYRTCQTATSIVHISTWTWMPFTHLSCLNYIRKTILRCTMKKRHSKLLHIHAPHPYLTTTTKKLQSKISQVHSIPDNSLSRCTFVPLHSLYYITCFVPSSFLHFPCPTFPYVYIYTVYYIAYFFFFS